MLADFLGQAQIAAILVLVQRGLEELHSPRNTRALVAQGAPRPGAATIRSSR